MSVVSSRAGAKATPETVFPVCDALQASQGSFRADEVLARTGGGMGTVNRLVKLWRAHEKIIKANEALDANVTISLVQALDQLLKQQVERSNAAVEEFLATGGTELAQVSHALEETEALVIALKEERQQQQQELRSQADANARLTAQLAERDRELADARSQVTLKTDEIRHLQASHSAKLEQLASQHQTELARALEAQRKAMVDEHAHALDALNERHRQAADAIQARADKVLAVQVEKTQAMEAQVREIQEREQQARNAAQKLEQTLRAEVHSAAERSAELEALVAEKQSALNALQHQQRELMNELRQDLAGQSDTVQAQLAGVARTAEQATTVLADLSTMLSTLRTQAERPANPQS